MKIIILSNISMQQDDVCIVAFGQLVSAIRWRFVQVTVFVLQHRTVASRSKE